MPQHELLWKAEKYFPLIYEHDDQVDKKSTAQWNCHNKNRSSERFYYIICISKVLPY